MDISLKATVNRILYAPTYMINEWRVALGTPTTRLGPFKGAFLYYKQWSQEPKMRDHSLPGLLWKDMANRLLAERDTPSVGERWASNFVKRQPQLRTRFFRRYGYKRIHCEDSENIRGLFALVRNTIAKYGVTESDIHNLDETGFMMDIISTGMVVTSADRRSDTKLAQPGIREWVTVIQGVNPQDCTVPRSSSFLANTTSQPGTRKAFYRQTG